MYRDRFAENQKIKHFKTVPSVEILKGVMLIYLIERLRMFYLIVSVGPDNLKV